MEDHFSRKNAREEEFVRDFKKTGSPIHALSILHPMVPQAVVRWFETLASIQANVHLAKENRT
jgi:hypothetical protein